MRGRLLGWMVALMLFAGATVACSDDSGDDGGGDDGDSGDSDDGDINANVQAYCDEVADFLAQVEEAGSDDAALLALVEPAGELVYAGQVLAAAASDDGTPNTGPPTTLPSVGDFTTEDAEALADCQAEVRETAPARGG